MAKHRPTTGRISSGFRPPSRPGHDGVDIAAPCGTPIVATEDGTVIAASAASGYGYWIRIDHGGGIVSEYGHMPWSSFRVRQGDRVRGGQHIADVGTEGNSTGCHLHWEIQRNGVSINPLEWLAEGEGRNAVPLWGIDYSHYQGDAIQAHDLVNEGFSFVIIKATEGAGWTDGKFAENYRDAKAAGLVTAAYHYQRPDSVASQINNIKSMVPWDCPIALDVEAGSGDVALTRRIVDALRAEGYTPALLYLPPWYWEQIGRPSLAGLPPLWCSRWPDTNGGYASQIYQRVPGHYWDGYGGNEVAVLQFSAHATVSEHTPVDVNAFRGTRAELEALFNQEDDVSAQDVWGHQIGVWDPWNRWPTEEEMSAARMLHQTLVYSREAQIVGHGLQPAINNLTELVRSQNAITPEQLAEALKPAITSSVGTSVTEGLRAAIDALELDLSDEALQQMGETFLAVIAAKLAPEAPAA